MRRNLGSGFKPLEDSDMTKDSNDMALYRRLGCEVRPRIGHRAVVLLLSPPGKTVGLSAASTVEACRRQ